MMDTFLRKKPVEAALGAFSGGRDRRGSALLVVLIVVMVITTLAVGYIARSDAELQIGQNMVLKARMDYLAESGLEHGRAMVLRPQDVNEVYWSGASDQQLTSGNDYYDITVTRDPVEAGDYLITSQAYRIEAGNKIAASRLEAELRLDPLVAIWAGDSWTSEGQTTVNGDVYCNNDLGGTAIIRGDGFAGGSVTASGLEGKAISDVSPPPVAWPGILSSDLAWTYYIVSSSYSAESVASGVHSVGTFDAGVGNPAGVRYCTSDLELSGDVVINGTLVVGGDLTITGESNVIRASKNFPALVVEGDLIFATDGSLEIYGLAQIGGEVDFEADTDNAHLDVEGALFIGSGSIAGLSSDTCSVTVTADITKAAIEIWSSDGSRRIWSPAGGAFYRALRRY